MYFFRIVAADRLPVVVRFLAGLRVRRKTVDPPKGNGLGQKKQKKRIVAVFFHLKFFHVPKKNVAVFQI